MNNEWYIDRFADSIDDEDYIKEYQQQFKEDMQKILESETENGQIQTAFKNLGVDRGL